MVIPRWVKFLPLEVHRLKSISNWAVISFEIFSLYFPSLFVIAFDLPTMYVNIRCSWASHIPGSVESQYRVQFPFEFSK